MHSAVNVATLSDMSWERRLRLLPVILSMAQGFNYA